MDNRHSCHSSTVDTISDLTYTNALTPFISISLEFIGEGDKYVLVFFPNYHVY